LRGQLPQVVASDGRVTMAGELILIGNGRFYGGRFHVFPAADLRDGVLEVSVLPRANWVSIFRSGWGLLTDQLYTTGGVRHFKAPSFTLESGSTVPFHLDGENV